MEFPAARHFCFEFAQETRQRARTRAGRQLTLKLGEADALAAVSETASLA